MPRPEFTVAGTALVVILGLLAGAPAGVLYSALAERVPGPARLRGLSFGAICLAAIGQFFLTTGELFTAGRVVLFAPLFLLFGVVAGIALTPTRSLAARYRSRRNWASRSCQGRWVYWRCSSCCRACSAAPAS